VEETILYARARRLAEILIEIWNETKPSRCLGNIEVARGMRPRTFLLALTWRRHGCYELHFCEKSSFGESRNELCNQQYTNEVMLPNYGSRMFQIEFIPELWIAVNLRPCCQILED